MRLSSSRTRSIHRAIFIKRKWLKKKRLPTVSAESDKNLLVAILTFQLGFVSRDQLIAAMQGWLENKQLDIAEILRAQGALSSEQLLLLQALVAEHLRRHDHDPQKSLAALSTIESVRDDLQQMADSDLTRSLEMIASDRARGTARKSGIVETSVGASSSAGSRFRILRPHAAGGLGKVSVAQDIELRREVALKEIQPKYSDHPDSRLRFLQEAEITGRLEHPGIVPVYGLGTYGDGRPFYAMRMIRGQSLKEAITEFHQAEGPTRDRTERILSMRNLLRRFVDICNAVEYAHSRGILHRDLKPGNIMLGKYGETLVVDWGLAKPIARTTGQVELDELTLVPELSGDSAATQAGTAVGTIPFMSPEQAAGQLDLLSPASDVYSLGATLYTLLTGTLSQTGTNDQEMLQNVRSGRLRRPRELVSSIAPALESICLKAMALDPADRYPSALHLAQDVERFLADEPVAVHRDSILVGTGRWMRKHPRTTGTLGATVALGIVGLLVISGLVGVHNRQLERERKRAEAVAEYLVKAFRSPDPDLDGKKITIFEVLDRTSRELDQEFDDDPETKARLYTALGETIRGLGLYGEAVELLRHGYELRTSELPDNYEKAIDSARNLAFALHLASSYSEESTLAKQTLAKATKYFGRGDPKTLLTEVDLARAELSSGNAKKAITRLESAYPKLQSLLGRNDHDVLQTASTLAAAFLELGSPQKAAEILASATDSLTLDAGGKESLDPELAAAMGYALLESGESKKSEALFRKLVDQARAKYGDDHGITLLLEYNLALTLHEQLKFERAIELFEPVLAGQRKSLGNSHRDTLQTASMLADSFRHAGGVGTAQALEMQEETVKLLRAKLGDDNPDTLYATLALAVCNSDLGNSEVAITQARDAIERLRRLYGDKHPAVWEFMERLGLIYKQAQKLQEAADVLHQTVEAKTTLHGADDIRTLESLDLLALVYRQRNQVDKVIPLLERVVPGYRRDLGDAHNYTHEAMYFLAECYASVSDSTTRLPCKSRLWK